MDAISSRRHNFNSNIHSSRRAVAMKSRRIRMSFDEFELLPMHPGWKNEYFNGEAIITPRHNFAITSLDITLRGWETPFSISPIAPADEPQLVEAFFDAFKDTAEYCDWQETDIYKSALDAISTH